MTVLFAIIVSAYGYLELVSLATNDSTRIFTYKIVNKIPRERVFDLDKKGNGFEIAIGLTAYVND